MIHLIFYNLVKKHRIGNNDKENQIEKFSFIKKGYFYELSQLSSDRSSRFYEQGL